ncbi:unnamed protein product, partial [Cladocopium goreaui]
MSDQVPPSDTSTALDQWDLVTHTSGDAQDKNEKLANVVYNEIKGQKTLRHEFYVWVASEIGVDPTIMYAGKFQDIPTAKPKEEGSVAPACVPLQLFSFSDDAGLTGAPELEKARLLLHLLCAYGFETVDESVKAQWKPEDDIAEGQLLFLKGQLRILTVLSLLAVVHRRKATLSVHPTLQQTLQKVRCVHVELTNRKEELFYNFKVAVKGNIRTAPSAVTWVNSLLELSKAGDRDLQGTLNSWNTQAPKPDKVQGQKYLTVKNLLDLPPECRNVMFAYINKNGWDSSPYSEDLLSSKKLLVNFNFKTTKADPTALAELSNAVSVKDQKYTVRDNPSLKTILDNHGQVSDKAEPGKPVSAMVDLMDQKQKQIDKSNLELVMNELSFDLESFKVYRQKVVQCMSNRARKIQDWKGQVVQDAQQAADHYMSLHVTLKTWATQDPGAAAITDVKKDVAQRARALQVPEDGSVIISLMNLSAPALVSASHMPAIMHVVGYLCSDNVKNLALALMPVYSYTRNYLWKEEAT